MGFVGTIHKVTDLIGIKINLVVKIVILILASIANKTNPDIMNETLCFILANISIGIPL